MAISSRAMRAVLALKAIERPVCPDASPQQTLEDIARLIVAVIHSR